MAKALRLKGAHAGKSLAIGSLQFLKGVSSPLTEADAATHLGIIHSLDANAGQLDAKGEPLPFKQAYHAEICDPAAEAREREAKAAAPAPKALAGKGAE